MADYSLPLPPGSLGLPVLGESIAFLLDPNYGDKKTKKYGPIFKTNVLSRKTIFMNGAEANKFILSSHLDHFSWGKGWPNNFRELLGRSLFLQDGAEHQRNRKLLMPAFHGQALSNYVQTMEQIIDKYLQKWETKKTFTWQFELKQMTFEVASVLLLGSSPGEQVEELSQWFTELTRGLFAVLPIRAGWAKYGKALTARNRLLNYLDQEIESRQSNLGKDALGLMLQARDEEGDRLSREEIKVQALLMLFAGHETTTSMLTFLCMILSQRPDILARARAEQLQLAVAESLSTDHLKQMIYLEQVLKEVERCYPPVGGGFRGVVKPFVFNGYYVPEGWIVSYRIGATHQDPTIFTRPEIFDPDRFNSERAEHKKTDFSLVGFGGGPRFCLGYAFAQMEMKIFASRLLCDYQWKILPDQDLTPEPIPSLHPKSGLEVEFSRLPQS